MYVDNEAFLFEMPVRIILTCSSELLQKSTGAYSFSLSLLGIVNTVYIQVTYSLGMGNALNI